VKVCVKYFDNFSSPQPIAFQSFTNALLFQWLARKASKSNSYKYGIFYYYLALSAAFFKNRHSICPCIESSQGGMSLRQTRIGLPWCLKSIPPSPSTTSVRRRR